MYMFQGQLRTRLNKQANYVPWRDVHTDFNNLLTGETAS